MIEGYAIKLLPYPRVIMEYLGGQNLSTTFLHGNFEAFEVEAIVRCGGADVRRAVIRPRRRSASPGR